jgi:hypothetical protein
MNNFENMIRDIFNFVNNQPTQEPEVMSIDVIDMLTGKEFTLYRAKDIPTLVMDTCNCMSCSLRKRILAQRELETVNIPKRRFDDIEVDPEMAKRVKLNADLQAAINVEDYEEAALIKEEIDRFEKLLKNSKEKS